MIYSLGLNNYLNRYESLFRVYQRQNKEKAVQYITELFHEGKHNIEWMNERIAKINYQQLNHFIIVSPWDHDPAIRAVRKDISVLFEGCGEYKGLILDESGHRNIVKKSVGVARQYLGSIGKVDNGQVSVFAALSQGDDVGKVDIRLYLPKRWSEDNRRCKKAGIPKKDQAHKSKAVLALQMIQQMRGEVKYDWVEGDSIYGNSKNLWQGLQQLE